MSETYLDYDKQIWKAFSVGILSSIVILYKTYDCHFPKQLNLPALILGFFVLVYSFLLILSYGYKKSLLKENRLAKKLSIRFYPRVRWIAEFIIFFFGVFYFSQFEYKRFPLFILGIVVLFCLINNLIAKRKFEKKSCWFNGKFLFSDFFKKFFC